MNVSNFEHAAFALLMQIAIAHLSLRIRSTLRDSVRSRRCGIPLKTGISRKAVRRTTRMPPPLSLTWSPVIQLRKPLAILDDKRRMKVS